MFRLPHHFRQALLRDAELFFPAAPTHRLLISDPLLLPVKQVVHPIFSCAKGSAAITASQKISVRIKRNHYRFFPIFYFSG